jgi:hypothetical protein
MKRWLHTLKADGAKGAIYAMCKGFTSAERANMEQQYRPYHVRMFLSIADEIREFLRNNGDFLSVCSL